MTTARETRTRETSSPATDALTWDLSCIYADLTDPRIKSDQVNARTEAEAFASEYRGRPASTGAGLPGSSLTPFAP